MTDLDKSADSGDGAVRQSPRRRLDYPATEFAENGEKVRVQRGVVFYDAEGYPVYRAVRQADYRTNGKASKGVIPDVVAMEVALVQAVEEKTERAAEGARIPERAAAPDRRRTGGVDQAGIFPGCVCQAGPARGAARDVASYLAVDMAGSEPGEYVIEVAVTDRGSGEEVSKKAALTLPLRVG